MGTGVYQQGRMIAFSVIELLENGYAMGHFAKCDARFSGLSHYLYQATARAASEPRLSIPQRARGPWYCRIANLQDVASPRFFLEEIRRHLPVGLRIDLRPAVRTPELAPRLLLLFRSSSGETLRRQAAASQNMRLLHRPATWNAARSRPARVWHASASVNGRLMDECHCRTSRGVGYALA